VKSALSFVTRSGWTLFGLVCIALPAGYLAGYRVLFGFGLTGAILLAFAAVAVLLRPGLQVERSIHPQRVTVGDDALGAVVVTNTSRRPSLAQAGRDWVGDRSIPVALPALSPGRHKSHRYLLPTDKRAAVRVGPFVVRQSDPFALWTRDRDHGELLDFYVHPRRYPLTRLPASRRLSLEGPTSDRAPRGSTTFHAIRHYVPGDDRRHIHWKASARSGELMVRQLVDTSEPSLSLVLDVGADRYQDAELFEGAVEITASLAEAASAHGFPVRLHTTGGDAWLGRHDEPDMLLDELARLHLSSDSSLDRARREILAGPRGPTLIVVGGRFDAADAVAAESMRSHFGETSIVSIGEMGVALGASHAAVGSGAEFAALWNARVIE
jgi:uncharacterized protein (DUF58 family)